VAHFDLASDPCTPLGAPGHHRNPFLRRCRTFLYHPCGFHRLAHVLPEIPHRDHGCQCQRPSVPAGLQRSRKRRGRLLKASSSTPRARSMVTPPRKHPHPRDLPGERFLHRSQGLLRRIEAVWRSALRQFCAPVRPSDVKVARPFNNYGPGLKITDKRVLPDFARDIFAGRDIVMHSDGSPTRTFCYVADAIVGYYKILVRGRPGKPTTSGWRRPRFPCLIWLSL
jgi:hypothetical protein